MSERRQIKGLSGPTLGLLLAAFIATRIVAVVLAHGDSILAASFGDMQKYQQWGTTLRGGGVPYADVAVEYPPGVLPFLALAEIAPLGGDFAHRFILVMAAVDLAGFTGLVLLARRTGQTLGVWAWLAGPLALGPLIYLRLDFVPAVATIWAFERATADRWGETGGWLAFGAMAKVYPAFLFVPAARVASALRHFVIGAVVMTGLYVLPFVFRGGGAGLWDSVVGYHTQRGIHVESTWGFLSLLASKFGVSMRANYQFGSNEVVSDWAASMRLVSTTLSVLVLFLGTWWLVRNLRQRDVGTLAMGSFALLALLIFVGKVFSPQFVIWLVALAAVALSFEIKGKARWALLGVLPLAVLTQGVYPHTINEVLAPFYVGATEAGNTFGVVLLGVRNAALLAIGLAAFMSLRNREDAADQKEAAA